MEGGGSLDLCKTYFDISLSGGVEREVEEWRGFDGCLLKFEFESTFK